MPGAGEVLVQVKVVALCATDLHIYTGDISTSPPRVMGHEFAGTVEELGEGVTGFTPGDNVAVNPNPSCGTCERCRANRPNLCQYGGLLGRDADGALREYVPVPQDLVFKLPPGISFEEGALAQPLSTVVHGQQWVPISPHDTVVVLGQGAIGLLHTRLAVLSGAAATIAVERSPWKLELARQMGADSVVNAAQGDAVAQVNALTGGRGADVVIEAVGIPETILQSWQMVKHGGRLLQFGIPSAPLPSTSLYRLYLKEVQVTFPRGLVPGDYPTALALLADGRIDLKPLITGEHPLEETAQVFHLMEEDPDQVLRALIKF
ncbi:MAG: zinc-binding dehydrogenase [Dehalococcoidia bacterium]